MPKKRVDFLLVQRGLAPGGQEAQGLVMAGRVFSGQRRIEKSGSTLDESAPLHVSAAPRYVGRGGLKLEHALSAFRLNVHGVVALDVGASTGGFTHCLLEHGAGRVYAVDVGYGQLDFRLRQDSRVTVMERINARYPFPLPELVGLVTVDVSFISLALVVPSIVQHLKVGGHLVALIKPQFQARRYQVQRGGVVWDPAVHAATVGRFCLWAIQQRLRIRGVVPSPIVGEAGNREFFVLVQKDAP